MMPWWFWVLLWAVLLLGTVLFLVLAGFKLFRGVMKLLDETSDSMDRLSEPFSRVHEHPAPGPVSNVTSEAPFRDVDQVREEYLNGKEKRREARRAARVARKYAKGQPQRVSDLHLF